MKPPPRSLLPLLVGLLPALLAAGDLKLATWNLCNYLLRDRPVQGTWRFAYPKPESEKAALRQALLLMDADVLLLQETGGDAFLRELQLDLRALGLDYPHRAAARSPAHPIGLGVLSRHPLDQVLFHEPVSLSPFLSSPAALSRGILEIAFSHDGLRYRVFLVHLKSRYTSDPADPESRRRRAAEIQALARFLQPWTRPPRPGEHLLLAGDFNAPFSDPLLDPLKTGWRPLSARDAHGDFWTYLHRRSDACSRIDGFWIPRAARPFPGVASLPQMPPPFLTASDHRPVSLIFPAPCPFSPLPTPSK